MKISILGKNMCKNIKLSKSLSDRLGYTLHSYNAIHNNESFKSIVSNLHNSFNSHNNMINNIIYDRSQYCDKIIIEELYSDNLIDKYEYELLIDMFYRNLNIPDIIICTDKLTIDVDTTIITVDGSITNKVIDVLVKIIINI